MINEKDAAYNAVLAFAHGHYENFPVASVFIPKKLRKHIAVVYWFARTADDLADEGNTTAEQRLTALNAFEQQFNRALAGEYHSPQHAALAETIRQFSLNPALFSALLSAFRQDVTKKRYHSFKELLDYCTRSANPVGRLVLALHGINHPEAVRCSDLICTALQLTNFYQDTAIDFSRGRVYVPQDELTNFGVTEAHFSAPAVSEAMCALYRFQAKRAEKMFLDGTELLNYLSGRLKWEIRWTIAGGMKILYHLEKNNFDTLTKRVVLSKLDFLTILFFSPAKVRAGNS